MKFGARILKTGIAVTLALYITMLFGLEPVTFAAVSAVFAVQPSVYRSYQTILEQFQGNVIGAVVAIIFTLAFGNEPFVIGFSAILLIAICIKLNIEKTIPLAIVTLIVIMDSSATGGNFFLFALSRFAIIMIGVLCSFIVNILFLPPKHDVQLFEKILKNTEQITQWLRLMIRHDAEHIVLKDALQKIQDELIETNNLYKLYKEERNYFFKKHEFTKARKLVVFKQMITTAEKAVSVLKNLHFYEQNILNLPNEMKILLKKQIDHLTQLHERTLLKFAGKVRHEPAEKSMQEIERGEKALTERLIIYSEKKRMNDENWTELFQTIGLIIAYKEHLKHLDLLIDSFQTYHPEKSTHVDE